MTALVRFPNTPADFQRLTERQRRDNLVEDARAVLRSPEAHPDRIILDACAVLQAWGDGTDWLTADAMIFAVNRRERLANADATRLETPREVAARHAHRWPALAVGSAVAALVLLQFTGWGM